MLEILPPSNHASPEFVEQLATQLDIPRPLALLLASRGVQSLDHAKIFLDWDRSHLLERLEEPTALKGLDTACEILLEARRQGQTVVIHGDYDVDGMTGTAVLYLALRRAGFNCGWTLPRRDGEGYGLTDASLERCQRGEDVWGLPEGAAPGASVVISVDTGISAGPAIERAAARGLRTIITDHHLVGEGFPDRASAVINPQQEGCAYPNKALCGAGVAWKLGLALLRATGSEANPLRLLQLVALGTLADMVPLGEENLALVRMGLQELREQPLPGIAALLDAADISTRDTPNAQELVYRVTPRLNSAGRLRRGEIAVHLLLTATAEEAKAGMHRLEALNHERQALDQRITSEAMAMCEVESAHGQTPAAFVIFGSTWHEGVNGIVAQRIAERWHRPTFVWAPDPGRPGELRGSARSAGGVDIHKAMQECNDLLERWGGHKQAAGASLRVERLDAFRDAIRLAIARQDRLDESQISTDADMEFSDLTPGLMEVLDRMAPWGSGHPVPVFRTVGVTLVSSHRVGDGKHIKAVLRHGETTLDGIGFGLAAQVGELPNGIQTVIAFTPEWNVFRGRKTLQLRLKGIV